jgi:hypothetical protein
MPSKQHLLELIVSRKLIKRPYTIKLTTAEVRVIRFALDAYKEHQVRLAYSWRGLNKTYETRNWKAVTRTQKILDRLAVMGAGTEGVKEGSDVR